MGAAVSSRGENLSHTLHGAWHMAPLSKGSVTPQSPLCSSPSGTNCLPPGQPRLPQTPADRGGPQPCTPLGHCSTGDSLGPTAATPPDVSTPFPTTQQSHPHCKLPPPPTHTHPRQPPPHTGLGGGEEEEQIIARELELRTSGLENKGFPEVGDRQGPGVVTPFPQCGSLTGNTRWLRPP